MTLPVAAPANLPDLVRAAFIRARSAGDLLFFPTQVTLLHVRGIPFQLRFAPSLANKPKAAKPAQSKSEQPFDPFEDPPAGLIVMPRLGPHHRLLLNKFAVSPDHALLTTVDFRPQHHLLSASDLAAAYACIEAYGGGDSGDRDGLFVFFNSGPHSGASQPHRHLQLLPEACMRKGMTSDDAAAWGLLADRLTEGGGQMLPFYVASAPLLQRPSARNILADATAAKSPSPDDLHAIYLDLYRKACAAAGQPFAKEGGGADIDSGADADEIRGHVPARISYNLALTRKTMLLCPRTAEGAAVPYLSASTKGPAGHLSLNGTLLAGTALVKNEAEWDALRHDPAKLEDVLGKIGVAVEKGTPSQKPASL